MKAETIRVNPEVVALLEGADLPTSDLADRTNLSFLGVRKHGLLMGVVGIEAFDGVGMIRSLVVAPASRGCGLGLNLVADAEAHASGHGITTLYLLTTTAAYFFTRIGYEAVARSEAPVSIAATAQFMELCPASSIFMRKALTQGTRSQ